MSMQRLSFVIFVMVLLMPVTESTNSDRFSCLPKDVDLKAKIQEDDETAASLKPKQKKSVEQRLIELNARCEKGILIDKSGKEIRFVHLLGCWGNPPEDYQEQLDQQQAEVSKLKKKFTVVQIPCNQDTPISEIN